jgi:hypothetical protein
MKDLSEFDLEELFEHIPGEKYVFEFLDPTWKTQQLEHIETWMIGSPAISTGMFGASINGSLVCFEWGQLLEDFE